MEDQTHQTETAEALRPTGKVEGGRGAKGEALRTRDKESSPFKFALPLAFPERVEHQLVGVATQHGGQEWPHLGDP